MSSVPSNASLLDDDLLEALRSSKDRVSVLRLEEDLVSFLGDASRDVHEVPALNSYHRRIAHKVGDYYQVTHVPDHSRHVLLFHKHPWSKVPSVKLSEVSVGLNQKSTKARPQTMQTQTAQIKIMKRAVSSPPTAAIKPVASITESASDSKEKEKLEKEERYKAARARIFQGVEESSTPARDKASRSISKPNSRSNSRDARLMSGQNLNGNATEFIRRVSDTHLYDTVSDLDIVQSRHQQYFQTDLNPATSYSRPPVEHKNHQGVWNPKSTAPLSAANLAALEAQTSQQPTIPSLVYRVAVNSTFDRSPNSAIPSRSLAPPTNASGNLWAPPASASPRAQRNASSLGLNLSASPWTPKQSTSPAPLLPNTKVDYMLAEDHNEDPANVLRGLALDDK